jgi:Tol biopolymer transport system component
VSGPVAQEKQGIWMISVIGATLKKLRDDAYDASLSPDGTQIVFRDSIARNIWLMNADGGQARVVIKKEPSSHMVGPTWFKNGKRILYERFWQENGKNSTVLESRDLNGGDPNQLLSNAHLVDFSWGQTGRLIYSVRETPPNQYDSNLWELYFDESTGKPKTNPRRLTDWTGFFFSNLQLTADEKRLVFMNGVGQSDVYIGELANGASELKSPQRLTLDDRVDWPGGWSEDSKTVFLYSDRAGSFDIYKQGVNERNATAIVTGPEEEWAPQMSPDGKWILYLQWPKVANGDLPGQGKLMRVPIGGGPSEAVTDVKGHPGLLNNTDPTNSVGGLPSFRCVAHATTCVLAEEGDNSVVFTAIDPVQGRKAELTKAAVNPDLVAWDLSPDGSRVALTIFDYKAADVEIVTLAGGAMQKLSAMPWTQLVAVAWTADGKGLFLASFSSRGTGIVRIDATGGAPKLLLKQPSWDIFALTPSPDGNSLAFGPLITSANAWTIANFPAK